MLCQFNFIEYFLKKREAAKILIKECIVHKKAKITKRTDLIVAFCSEKKTKRYLRKIAKAFIKEIRKELKLQKITIEVQFYFSKNVFLARFYKETFGNSEKVETANCIKKPFPTIQFFSRCQPMEQQCSF